MPGGTGPAATTPPNDRSHVQPPIKTQRRHRGPAAQRAYDRSNCPREPRIPSSSRIGRATRRCTDSSSPPPPTVPAIATRSARAAATAHPPSRRRRTASAGRSACSLRDRRPRLESKAPSNPGIRHLEHEIAGAERGRRHVLQRDRIVGTPEIDTREGPRPSPGRRVIPPPAGTPPSRRRHRERQDSRARCCLRRPCGRDRGAATRAPPCSRRPPARPAARAAEC